jgi:hypothetical protein
LDIPWVCVNHQMVQEVDLWKPPIGFQGSIRADLKKWDAKLIAEAYQVQANLERFSLSQRIWQTKEYFIKEND